MGAIDFVSHGLFRNLREVWAHARATRCAWLSPGAIGDECRGGPYGEGSLVARRSCQAVLDILINTDRQAVSINPRISMSPWISPPTTENFRL